MCSRSSALAPGRFPISVRTKPTWELPTEAVQRVDNPRENGRLGAEQGTPQHFLDRVGVIHRQNDDRFQARKIDSGFRGRAHGEHCRRGGEGMQISRARRALMSLEELAGFETI